MSKLDTAKKLFDIGKAAAEIYDTIADARKKRRDVEEKDRKIAELEAEIKRLKEKKD